MYHYVVVQTIGMVMAYDWQNHVLFGPKTGKSYFLILLHLLALDARIMQNKLKHFFLENSQQLSLGFQLLFSDKNT